MPRSQSILPVVMALTLTLTTTHAQRNTARPFNGFEVSNATIPLDAVYSGGPPRDGIPSIDNPKFTRAGLVDYLQPEDLVVSVTLAGETRAYPLRILVWHEIVNDRIGQRALAITYCPLCGTAMVFDRAFGGNILEFGVSGLLFQSDVLMYDRQTESLWSQLEMKAVAGPLVNTPLNWLPSEHLTWAAWQAKYPDGRVLSTRTGHQRNYQGQAYAGYERREATMFPVPKYRSELRNKEWVAGILVNGHAAAFPLATLGPLGTGELTVGGVPVQVTHDPGSQAVLARNRTTGEVLPFVKVYWFAWQAFYPETLLWQAP